MVLSLQFNPSSNQWILFVNNEFVGKDTKREAMKSLATETVTKCMDLAVPLPKTRG